MREFERLAPGSTDDFGSIVSQCAIDEQFAPLHITQAVQTLPNQLALLSCGFPHVTVAEASKPADESIEAVRAAFNAVVELRERFARKDDYPPRSTSLLMSSASVSRYLIPGHKLKKLGPDNTSLVDAYTHIQQHLALGPLRKQVSIDSATDVARSVLSEREAELRGQVAAVITESCGQLAPTAMLQNAFGRRGSYAENLRDAFLWRPKHWRQTATQEVKRIGDSQARALPAYVLDYIKRTRGTVKALVDEPIELTTIADRPLNMLRPVVKVPVTPGFLLHRQAAATPLFIARQDFRQILVLRGTSRQDPVHWLLEEASTSMAKEAKDTTVIVKDVAGPRDIEDALADFEGAMVVVDAHGVHSRGDVGLLEFGEVTLDMSRIDADLPPIVVLASCESHALGRSEATVASALLCGGARVVIATLVPIQAASANLLVSDLVGRVSQWCAAPGLEVRWSEFFACSQWVCHAIEAAFVLVERKAISLTPQQIGVFADRLERSLGIFVDDWFSVACAELASMTDLDADHVRQQWLKHAYVTDCSMFCQLGHTDAVFIEPIRAGSDSPSREPTEASVRQTTVRSNGLS